VIIADGVGIGDRLERVERGLVGDLGRAAQQHHRAIDRGEFLAGDHLETPGLQFGEICGGQIERDEFAATIAEAVTVGVDPVALVIGGALGLGLAAGEEPLAGIIVEIVRAVSGLAAIIGDVVAVIVAIVASDRAFVVVITASRAVVIVVIAVGRAAIVVVIAAGRAIVVVVATSRAVVFAGVITARIVVPASVVAACIVSADIVTTGIISASVIATDIVAARIITADIVTAGVVASDIVASDIVATEVVATRVVAAAGILIIGVGDVIIVIARVVIIIIIVVFARVLRGKRRVPARRNRAERKPQHQQICDDDPRLHRMPPFPPTNKAGATVSFLTSLNTKLAVLLFQRPVYGRNIARS
jgi:hypothetical protein